MDQLVQQHSETPNVQLVVLLLAIDNFRRQVLFCATKCVPAVFLSVGRAKAEIAKFVVSRVVDQNVLRFDVPVHHFAFVKVGHGTGDLLEDFEHFGQAENLLFDRVEQSPVLNVLEYEVKSLAFLKRSEQPYDVRVVELAVDLYFPLQSETLVGFDVRELNLVSLRF